MANRHYGDLADVFKHLALGETLAGMRPAEYWESHAGAAFYEEPAGGVGGGIPAQRGHGIHHFAAAMRSSMALRGTAYGGLLTKSLSGVGEAARVARVPGTPLLANEFFSATVRRFLFCDTDAASLQSVRKLGGNAQALECVQEDGVSVLRGAALLLPEQWTATTLAFLDPEEMDAASEAEISPLELWCELASRGIRCVLFYGFADEAQRAARHGRFQQVLEKARLLQRGVQRFEGSLRLPAGSEGVTRWGFGLLTMHLPGQALERVDKSLKALEGAYGQAVLTAGSAVGTGAWSYARAWM